MYRKIRNSKIKKEPSSTPAEDIGNNVLLKNKIIDKRVQGLTYDLNKNKSNNLFISELSSRGNKDMASTDLLQNQSLLNKKNIGANNINNNKNLTPRDLEIMNIFTSRRWSKKSYPRSIVNMQIDKKESPVKEEIEKDISVRIDYKKSSDNKHEEFKNSTSKYENTNIDIARDSNDDEHANLENNRESFNELVKISTEEFTEVLRDEQDLENNEDNLNKFIRKSIEEFPEIQRDEQDLENNEDNLNKFIRKSIEEFPEIQRDEQDLENNQENINELVKISSERLSEVLRDEQDLEHNEENLNKFIEKSVEDIPEVQKDEQDLDNNQENLNELVKISSERLSEVLRDEQDLEHNEENLDKFIEKSIEDISEVQKDEQDLDNNQENLNENIRKSIEYSEVLSDTLSNTSFENMYFETSSMDTANKSESQFTSITYNKDMIFEDLPSDAEKMFKTSKNVNNFSELATNLNNIEEENYSYELNKDYSKEQVTSQKLGPTVELTRQLSKDEMWMNKAFMHHFYMDDISDSDIVDTSSIWSFSTTMMAQMIQNQVQTTNKYIVVEKPMIDESALNAALRLMFEKTKNSLGNQLMEGLYIVSRKHRQDPFRYLGQWLLIQADIRDENNV